MQEDANTDIMEKYHVEYVDLINVLYRLAVCIKPENYPYLSMFIPEPSEKISEFSGKRFWRRVQRQIDLAEQVGKAAALLSGSLHDSADCRPLFVRFDFTQHAVKRDAHAEREGQRILSRAIRCCEKEYWYCHRHYQKAMILGEEFLDNPIIRDVEDSVFVAGMHGLVPVGIGFSPARITAFLCMKGIESTFRTDQACWSRQ